MADYNINLVKSMVSSPEERLRFYNRMLIYLIMCSAAMVYTAYIGSMNLLNAFQANRERKILIGADTAVSDYGKDFYKDPEKVLRELSDYAQDLETLRISVSKRAHFLPVVNQLFKDFPENISLQNLNAISAGRAIQFELAAPLFDEEGGDPVADLRARWKSNEELGLLIKDEVEQLTIERRMVDDSAVSFVKFKCELK